MTDTIKARDCRPAEWPPEDDTELVAMSKARQQEYETTTLLDRELGLKTPEVGNALMLAAEQDLRSRGVTLADASHDELLDATQSNP